LSVFASDVTAARRGSPTRIPIDLWRASRNDVFSFLAGQGRDLILEGFRISAPEKNVRTSHFAGIKMHCMQKHLKLLPIYVIVTLDWVKWIYLFTKNFHT
jgi:hypothetical protein